MVQTSSERLPGAAEGVFEEAIAHSASPCGADHNHPSGKDAEPSEDDVKLTQRLVEAGRFFGTEVLDHMMAAPAGGRRFQERRTSVKSTVGMRGHWQR